MYSTVYHVYVQYCIPCLLFNSVRTCVKKKHNIKTKIFDMNLKVKHTVAFTSQNIFFVYHCRIKKRPVMQNLPESPFPSPPFPPHNGELSDPWILWRGVMEQTRQISKYKNWELSRYSQSHRKSGWLLGPGLIWYCI